MIDHEAISEALADKSRGKGLFGDGHGTAENLQPTVAVGAAMLTFLGGWAYAISEWGWFLGLVFGWLPAAIVASGVGFISYKLWWLVLAATGAIAAFVVYGVVS